MDWKRVENFIVALGCALSMLLTPLSLSAQDSPPPPRGDDAEPEAEEQEVEEIVVTGYRRSIQNAIDLKRDSDLILEAISAEDIGKLPDVSIAEALARAPGLAGQRLNGRAQVISVRGLAPDFTNTLLNGRQQVSVGDNRSVEYDQYPSGLISDVLIYKAPAGGLINQGLAGTVDLRTIRPLNLNERVINLNARYVWNTQDSLNADGDDRGQRFNIFYADQFLDGTLGVALGFAHLTNPSQGEHHRAWGYPGEDFNGDGENELVIGGLDSLVRTSELERNAFMAVAEWRPNDRFSAAFDLYVSSFEEENLLRGLEFGFLWGGAQACTNERVADSGVTDCTTAATISNGFVTAGQYRDVETLVRNDVESRDSDLLALGLNLTYDFNGWRTEFDWSYSETDREDQIIESYSGTGNGNTNFGGTRGGGVTGTVDFSSSNSGTRIPFTGIDHARDTFVLTDPHGWGGGGNVQAGYLNEPDIDDELNQFTVRAGRDLSWMFLSDIEAGLHFSTREKTKIANEAILSLGHMANTDSTMPPVHVQTKPLPDGVFQTRLDFLGIPGIQSYDPRPLIANSRRTNADGFCLDDPATYTYCLVDNTVHPDVGEKNWSVEEDVFFGYFQLGLAAEIAGMALKGNTGFQLVFSDQDSTASSRQRANNDVGTDTTASVSDGKSYVDFLPSLNLNLQITDNQLLRLSVARTMARARMDDLRASQQFGYNFQNLGSTAESGDTAFWNGSGGNPDLNPWRANAFDLSYEFYFPDEAGYFAVAYYYKDLVSWVYRADRPYDYSVIQAALRADFERVDLRGILDGLLADAMMVMDNPDTGDVDERQAAIDRVNAIEMSLTDPDTNMLILPTTLIDQTSSIGPFNAPLNGEGGEIQGFEISLALNGHYFHDALTPFGLLFNYSNNDSSVVAEPGTAEITLPGLSEDLANVTVFYERGGFAARLSARYRSEFIGELQGFGAGREFRLVDDEFVMDAQISYAFPEQSRLAGLSMFVQGTNINDEPFATFQSNDRRQVIHYQEYGATWYMGFSYKF